MDNLVALAFDHYLILLDREPAIENNNNMRSFNFENVWRIELGIKDVVSNSWFSSAGKSVVDKLDICANELSSWNKTNRN